MNDPRIQLLDALARFEAAAGSGGHLSAAQTRAFVAREPRCAERSLAEGHLTGSAWVINHARTHVLLTHHRKLNKWLQLGGHADGDLLLAAVAMREAEEESGLKTLRLGSSEIFDVDRHWIPERPSEPGHWHDDLCFLVLADDREPLVVSPESHRLAWVAMEELGRLSEERSLHRMAAKVQGRPV